MFTQQLDVWQQYSISSCMSSSRLHLDVKAAVHTAAECLAARYVSSWIGGILLNILGCGRHTDAIVIEPTVASVALYMDSTQIAFTRHLPAL
jgi:hypothetical protein